MSQPPFLKILHISPILDIITQPFQILQQKSPNVSTSFSRSLRPLKGGQWGDICKCKQFVWTLHNSLFHKLQFRLKWGRSRVRNLMSTHKIVVKNTETAFIMANGAKSQIDIGKLYSITLHRRNIGKGTTGSTSAFPKKTLFLFLYCLTQKVL